MKTKLTGWTLFIYALLVLAGGIIGFLKAQSSASLVMGIIFAILLLTSSWLFFKGRASGFYLGLFSTGVLGAFFLYRLILTHKFMPPGLMVILSLIVVLVVLSSKCKCCKTSC